MCGWRDSNPHAEAPDPKSGVSTNFTTPASFEGRKGTRFFSPVNPWPARKNLAVKWASVVVLLGAMSGLMKKEGAMWLLAMAGWHVLAWGQEWPQGLREVGGEIQGTQRMGVPWNGVHARMWGWRMESKVDEWTVGISHEGWSAWKRSALSAGGHANFPNHGEFEFLVGAGVVRWPELDIRSTWSRLDLAGTLHRPWGTLRCSVHAEAGLGRTLRAADQEILGRWDSLPWGWEAWWCPTAEGCSLPLPALGWTSDGNWSLMWSSSTQAWTQWRLWRKIQGHVLLTWSMPQTEMEVTWRVPIHSRNPSARVPSTASAGSGPLHARHFLRMGSAMERLQSQWQWGWEWSPGMKGEEL